MGFVDLTHQQIGLVMLMLAIITILAEERLAGLDSVFSGFLPPSEKHLERSRKAVVLSGIGLGVFGCAMLVAGILGI